MLTEFNSERAEFNSTDTELNSKFAAELRRSRIEAL